MTADKIHRGHAITEQVHADLKHSTLAYLRSKVFTAIAAWLGPGRDGATSLEGSGHDRSSHREGDDRHDPPQVDHRQDATSARRSTIYLPTAGPWLERLGVRRRD